MCVCNFSCCDDKGGAEPPFNKSTLVGEWKAVEIEVTSVSGKVTTITDPDYIKDELEDMAWIGLTERHIRPMNYRHVVLLPYEIIEQRIIFESGESSVTYELVSVTANELIIRYIGSWTSLITYSRITKEAIDSKMLLGEWRATLIDSYGYEITDEEKIKKNLQGLEWVILTEDSLTMVNKASSLSYSVKDNYLLINQGETQLSFAIESVSENKIVINSTDALITYIRIQKRDYNVIGKVEKGPFISGSSVTLDILNSGLRSTGKSYSCETTDNAGTFSFDCKGVDEAYVELKANGYFFNEVQNTLSNGTLTLKALADLNKGSNVNINILTHIKSARTKNLVSSGMDFSSADKKAQEELLDAFKLGSTIKKDVTAISIADGTEEAAALIAVSSLILMERTEAELTEYLAAISSYFAECGSLPEEIIDSIESDKKDLAKILPDIASNIADRYSSIGTPITVKNLFSCIDWNNDGIVGNETLTDDDKVIVTPSQIEVPNEGGSYTVHISSPIAVYLESQIDDDSEMDNVVIFQPSISGGGATSRVSASKSLIKYECELYDNILYINVEPLASSLDQQETISLYDYAGNAVATIELNQRGAAMSIDFCANYAESGTRAGNGIIPQFSVYGSKNNEILFDGTEIVYSEWSNRWYNMYQNEVKYWNSLSKYTFTAIVNATEVLTDESGMPMEIHFVSDGTTDLLYNKEPVYVTTDENSVPQSGVNADGYVPFEFSHLLARIKFEFASNNNIDSYKIKNIKISGVNNKGRYITDSNMWEFEEGETGEISLGDAYSKNESTVTSDYRLLIPGIHSFNISYDIEFNGEKNTTNLTINNIPTQIGSTTVLCIDAENPTNFNIQIVSGEENPDILTAK
ncbi:MAG: fimbrillin family protein [Bacteroidaceae bacterium]|nr:fimbrillin family protein [Bacteroidaceae bacterium]